MPEETSEAMEKGVSDAADHYEFRDLPMTPNIVAELAPRVLSSDLFRRSELIEAAQEYHMLHGGRSSHANVTAQAKKALNELRDRGIVESTPGYGMWRFVNRGAPAPVDERPAAEEEASSDDIAEIDVDERVVEGSGTGLVYAYYFPGYEQLATLRNEERWLVKVGMSTRGNLDRIYEQQTTAIPEEPVVGYARRTDTPLKLETVVHGILYFRQQQAQDAPGSEWFLTSPDEVRAIVHWVMGEPDDRKVPSP